MPKRPFEPCIPARGTKVPTGPDWIHEIKHDGYRLIVQRAGKRVRLFTRNGHDWTDRYPLIVAAALRNGATSFVIDGEAVLLGVDGVSAAFPEIRCRGAAVRFRRADARRRGPAEAATEPAQDQPRPIAGAPAGGHLRR
jgi:ATP-dependent DNA ligase